MYDKNKKHKWTPTEDDVLKKAVESCEAFLSESEIQSGKRTEAWWDRVSGCICLMTDGNYLVTAKAARARWRRLSTPKAEATLPLLPARDGGLPVDAVPVLFMVRDGVQYQARWVPAEGGQ